MSTIQCCQSVQLIVLSKQFSLYIYQDFNNRRARVNLVLSRTCIGSSTKCTRKQFGSVMVHFFYKHLKRGMNYEDFMCVFCHTYSTSLVERPT